MSSLAPNAARIVILDDDLFMLKLLTRMLAQLGFTQVVACTRGEEALQQLTGIGSGVDLIFLDINMPGMDGVEFIRRLADCRYSGSVILVSGETGRILESVEKLIEAQRLVALGHLKKPVNPKDLARLIGRLEAGTRAGCVQRVHQHAYSADELRIGFAQGNFVNYYQPKVALATGEVAGMESLVRWRHTTDGLVLPDKFIGLAADQGLLTKLTRVVLAAAMEQAKAWLRAGYRVPVAVNVSMDDLVALDFPDYVAALAASIGVEPQLITLEVTEGQVMRQLSTVLDVLSRLSLKRFQLAIDDFGTGHSSLAQLRDLPFDELKVDRSFVHGASVDATRRAICRASVLMAHQLQMQVVGEGIEDRDDWDFLCQVGCDTGQGYYIARPMPAEDVVNWLRDWRSRHCSNISRGT
jgi:EAL domain-containing protein (putative c-di-GMP-specific phosphodiesterase class I)/FixJ family two-component response regulator